MCSQLGIEMGGNGYIGMLNINGYAGMDSEDYVRELSVARLFVNQQLQAMYPEWILTDWGSGQIAFIIQGQDHPRSGPLPIEAGLHQLIETVYSQYRLSVNIALGSPYDVLQDISRSFDEARQALQFAASIGAGGITRFQDMIRESEMYDYSLETEQRLVNTIKAGHMEEGERIIEGLFARNFEERELSYDMRQQFIVELKGTLLKLTEQHVFFDEGRGQEIKRSLTALKPTDGAGGLKPRFIEITGQICSECGQKKGRFAGRERQGHRCSHRGAIWQPGLVGLRAGGDDGQTGKIHLPIVQGISGREFVRLYGARADRQGLGAAAPKHDDHR